MASQASSSKVSVATQEILENVATRGNQNKLQRLIMDLSPQHLRCVWDALADYVFRQLVSGRGVCIPKFGTFTFDTVPVDLVGVTNPQDRLVKVRPPVFKVAKEFAGGRVRSASVTSTHSLRPATPAAVGNVPTVKFSLIELSLAAKLPKAVTEHALTRVLQDLSSKVQAGESVQMELPSVGVLICQSHLVAVKFSDIVKQRTAHLFQVSDQQLTDGSNITARALFHRNRSQSVSQLSSHRPTPSYNEYIHTLSHSPSARSASTRSLHTDKERLKRPTTAGAKSSRKASRTHSRKYRSDGESSSGELSPDPTASVRSPTRMLSRNDLESDSTDSDHNEESEVTSRVQFLDHDNSSHLDPTDQSECRQRAGGERGRLLNGMNRTVELAQRRARKLSSAVDRAVVVALMQNRSVLELAFRRFDPASRGNVIKEDFIKAVRMSDLGVPDSQVESLTRLGKTRNGIDTRLFFEVLNCLNLGLGDPEETSEAKHQNLLYVALAGEIWRRRKHIAGTVNKRQLQLTSKVTRSEMKQLLVESGINLSQDQLASYLSKISDLIPHGVVNCLDIIQGSERYLSTYSADRSGSNQIDTAVAVEAKTVDVHDEQSVAVSQLRDVFYDSKFTLSELFRSMDFEEKGSVDWNQFNSRVKKLNPAFLENVIKAAWLKATAGNDRLTAAAFANCFRWKVSSGEWEESALSQIRRWIDKHRQTSAQVFRGFDRGSKGYLDLQDFRYSLNRQFHLSAAEADQLFRLLDRNGDGKIDIDEWSLRIKEESTPVQKLRDYIFERRISAEQFMSQLGLKIVGGRFDSESLFFGLQRLHPPISASDARAICTALNKSRDGVIEVKTFLHQVAEPESLRGDWKEDILNQIRRTLKSQSVDIEGVFRKLDQDGSGGLDRSELRQGLRSLGVGLEAKDLDQFLVHMDADDDGKIDLREFVDLLQGKGRDGSWDQIRNAIQRIKIYMRRKGQSVNQFLASVDSQRSGSVNAQNFASFLSADLQIVLPPTQFTMLFNTLDTNRDGLLDPRDLATAFKTVEEDRSGYQPPAALASKVGGGVRKRGAAVIISTVDELDMEITELLRRNKVTILDCFAFLDTNRDGYISFTDMSIGLSKLIGLDIASDVVRSIFEELDKEGIGLIDYKMFVTFVDGFKNRASKKPRPEVSVTDLVEMIRDWIEEHRFKLRQAFDILDRNKDGLLGRDDLRFSVYAIFNNLPVDRRPPPLTTDQLDSLIHYLDRSGANSVSFDDFEKVIDTRKSVAWDWKPTALKHLCHTIARTFNGSSNAWKSLTAKAATEQISLGTFLNVVPQWDPSHKLHRWQWEEIFKSICATDRVVILQPDWQKHFGHLQSVTEQLASDDKSTILTHVHNRVQEVFNSPKEAFVVFDDDKDGVVSLQDFTVTIEALFPKRFSEQQKAELWKVLCEGKKPPKHLNINQFKQFIWGPDRQRTGGSTESDAESEGESELVQVKAGSKGPSSGLDWEFEAVQRMRRMIQASSRSLRHIFQEMDTNRSGTLSILEFRKAIRRLNLGLTSRQIDLLLDSIDTNRDGLVDWNEFAAKFQERSDETERREKLEGRIRQLRNAMYEYMLSPKDAFRHTDSHSTGKISFVDFKTLVNRLCELGGFQSLADPILLELFRAIDVKQDKVIDLKEWLSCFKDNTDVNSNNFEDKEEFDQVCAAINRQRRLLYRKFVEADSRDVNRLSATVVQRILAEVLNIKLPADDWRRMLRVADKEGDGFIDYKLFLEIYRDRGAAAVPSHPRRGLPKTVETSDIRDRVRYRLKAR